MPFLSRLFALCLVPVFFATIASAQALQFSTLTADNVTYNSASGQLDASGHVVVIFDQTTMEADSISYNRITGEITAIGPIRISDGTGAVFTATVATLSPDLSAGIIRGAKLLLANRSR